MRRLAWYAALFAALAAATSGQAQPLTGGLLGRSAGVPSVPATCTTAGMVPVFLGSPVAMGCDAGLTYDAVTDALTSGTVTAKNITAAGLATPGSITVAPQGTGGAVTWTYKLVARLADGTTTEAGAASSTAAGNATLDGTNFNRLTWSAVTGAASYDVYRTVAGTTPSTTGKIVSATTALTADDTGIAGGGETAPTVDGTGRLTSDALTAGRVAIVGAGGRVEDDPSLTYDAVTDALTVANARAAGTYLQNGYQSWFDATAHNGTLAYRTILLNYNGSAGGGFIQSKNHQYAFSSNAGAGDGDVANTADSGLRRVSAGLVGVTNGSTGNGALQAGGVKYVTGSRPTCDAAARGMTWYVAGGSGVADTLEVCVKSAADTYSWVSLF